MTCSTCGQVFDDGGLTGTLFAIIGAGLALRCPGCSTEIELAVGDPEPYDSGPIADHDPLAPWHRDRARGIPPVLLPRYDADRSTWTVYGDDVESYSAATARIDNVKAGLTPHGAFDEVGASLEAFLAIVDDGLKAAEKLRIDDTARRLIDSLDD